MLICTYKFSDEFVKLLCHPLESVYVAYRLPVGGEVHATVSAQGGSPEVKAVGRCVTVKVSSEIPHSEGDLIATYLMTIFAFLFIKSLEPCVGFVGCQALQVFAIAALL